ncbi:MAG TPA: AMP-binding protein [Rhizomicrobium sp.]|nr:AMP-binding protein [Rhizomicrobium sp.]
MAAVQTALRDRLPNRRKFIDGWYADGTYGHQNLAAAMDEGARLYGDCETIFHSDTRPGRVTLASLHARSVKLAGALYALGVRQGDVVAVQIPNWIENVLAYQAAMQLGAIILPIVHIYGPKEVSFILRSSGAKVFITPDRWRNIDYLDRLSRLDIADVEHVVIVGSDIPSGAMSWQQFEARGTDQFPRSTAGADDPCLLVFTSGTTRDPKGVVHSHNSLIAANKMYTELGHMSSRTVTLGAGPAGHIGGVLNIFKLFLTGSGTIMLDTWNPEDAAQLVEKHKVDQCNGTPYFLSTLLDAAEREGTDLSSLTRYMVGGASVPASLIVRCDGAGLGACRSYGSTEVATVTASYIGDPLEKRANTDGRATPRSHIRIMGDNGEILPVGEEGEVAILSPQMFLGYSDPALNAESFTPDGWFLSGDIGKLDADGYLIITDRKKDIIIRGGENISSKEVEDVLATHPAVFESAVTAMPDSVLGERVCAFVMLRPSQSLTLDQVRQHFLAAGIAKPKTPERIVIIEEFPRTAAGKVKKFELRKQLKDVATA